MNKNTLKFITKPIWKPSILIGKGIKELFEWMVDGTIENLKDEDGAEIWSIFAVLSFLVTMLSFAFLALLVSVKAALITSFTILFPIYLAIYYTREYFKKTN